MFSPLSIEITKGFDKNTLKEYGIYFTPKPILDVCLNMAREAAEEYGIPITEILEPSCGSCEFVLAAASMFPDSHIDCVEYNTEIYRKIANLNTQQIEIYNADYLNWNNGSGKKYNLIVGNPPYFVVKKEDIAESYQAYLQGRPNIYIIFLLRAIEMLSENGVLSFVIPTNFLNCTYYLRTREYISTNFVIKSIVLCDEGGFLDTEQQTIILTVVKTPMESQQILEKNEKFILRLPNGVTIFNTPERISKMNELYRDSITLNDLGLNVSVGSVVWNECEGNQEKKKKETASGKGGNSNRKTPLKKEKFELSDDPNDTLLIYSSNIVDGKFVEQKFKNGEKKCFIKKEGITGPMMVINRGYGKGIYKMNYSIIDIDRPYLIENHLICLTVGEECENPMELYRLVERSLNDPRTSEFIELYFGNNAINCTELKNCFPIYL
jgi:tRNA1(Val) A37 N6-methylase TrmN6